ncbi:MAG: CHAT domain-containing protein [Methylococcales bacterium]
MHLSKHIKINIFNNLIIISVIILLTGMTSCSSNNAHISNRDNRYDYDSSEYKAMRQYSYKLQKKYDLLLEVLQDEYSANKISNNLLIGQLFSSIELARFYTYAFINYKKALKFYDEAEIINEEINKSGHLIDKKIGYPLSRTIYSKKTFASKHKKFHKENIISYYGFSGNQVKKKSYNYSDIVNKISSSRNSIRRILNKSRIIIGNKEYFPSITAQETDNYTYAIHVEKDILSPIHFSGFEKDLATMTHEYFKPRNELSKIKRDYYINFNILRGLTTVFNFSSLGQRELNKISSLIEALRNSRTNNRTKLDDAYLDFVNILLLSEIGMHTNSISSFVKLQERIYLINKDLSKHIDDLKFSRNKAVVIHALAVIGYTTASFAILSYAPKFGIRLLLESYGAIFYIFSGGNIVPAQREIDFIGESKYSKNIGILLDINDQLQLYRAAGKSYHITNNIAKSIEFNKEAVNIIANLRSTISTERERRTFAGYRDEIYTYLIDDLFRSSNYTDAFYYAENSRSRSLVDLLGSKGELSFGDKSINSYFNEVIDTQTYKDITRGQLGISDQQASYINELDNGLRNKPYKEIINDSSDNDNETIREKRKDIDTKESYKELLNLVTVNNLDYQEIQRIIPNETTLVEYFVSENNIYVWIIDRNNFSSHSLDLNKKLIKNEVQKFVHDLKLDRNINPVVLSKKSKKIYDSLFQPIEKYILNKSVIVVSHDFIHYLPFEALYTGMENLVEKYAFSYLPSASVLQFLEPIDGLNENILILGNPKVLQSANLSDLKGAEQESHMIASLFSNHKKLLNEQATETNFKKESHKFSISHIAGHGLFNNDNAMDSTLFLAPDRLNDGLLTAQEIFSIDKVSDLVVLSACETGQVEIGNGDELIGLTRSFFFSGASSLVASLWNVDDVGTSKLMEYFYAHMVNDKLSPKVALQQAKLDMVKSKEYSSPFYWAAFNMYGLGI